MCTLLEVSQAHVIHTYKIYVAIMYPSTRGYGDTDSPVGASEYTFHQLTQDIAEIIPALGHSTCVLVGHDWGGVVAW